MKDKLTPVLAFVTTKINGQIHHLPCRLYLGMWQILSGIYQGGLIRLEDVICL